MLSRSHYFASLWPSYPLEPCISTWEEFAVFPLTGEMPTRLFHDRIQRVAYFNFQLFSFPVCATEKKNYESLSLILAIAACAAVLFTYTPSDRNTLPDALDPPLIGSVFFKFLSRNPD